MTTTSDTRAATPRTIRVNDDLWEAFSALVEALDPNSSASARIRTMMQALVDEYSVFVAPEAEDIDPKAPRIAWYDCEECDMPHRVHGVQPWGCSVAKAHADRKAKTA